MNKLWPVAQIPRPAGTTLASVINRTGTRISLSRGSMRRRRRDAAEMPDNWGTRRAVPAARILDVREAGNVTVEYGRYTLGIEPQGADAMTQVGKYVVAHEAQADGSTKIALDIFNANTP